MTIVDNEIENLAKTQELISPFSRENLLNCRYNLRGEKAFRPTTGEEITVGTRKWKKRTHWVIKPSETLVIMTKETIKVPDNMFASYSQLNSLARRGLMLFNVSIVEPGYHGRLSCFLVNFSKESSHLYPDDDIAKICFHRLTGVPQALKQVATSDKDYEKKLAQDAQSYPTSFMDIGGVEKRIVARATKSVNRSITIAGVIIGLLVLWATLEPLTNKYLWERVGVMTTTYRVDNMKLQDELEKIKNEISRASGNLKTEKRIAELEEKLKTQTEQLTKLQESVKDH